MTQISGQINNISPSIDNYKREGYLYEHNQVGTYHMEFFYSLMDLSLRRVERPAWIACPIARLIEACPHTSSL